MVFLLSCSHISFASDEIRWINSICALGQSLDVRTEIWRDYDVPTQHSIIKSRVSFAHETSSGSNSTPRRQERFKLIHQTVPVIILATVAFGKERSSSPGGPEWPSRSDIVVDATVDSTRGVDCKLSLARRVMFYLYARAFKYTCRPSFQPSCPPYA
jgi:hypothetical protein